MSTDAENLAIRPLTEFTEFDVLVDMQQRFAGIESWEVYPKKLFKVAIKYGGAALCLFDRDNRPRGFAYHIPGQLNGELIGWSYLLIVDDSLQNSRWEIQLRQAQKERVLNIGINKLYWTIDPLDTNAALLNFSEIRIEGVRYLSDFPDKSGRVFHGMPMADRLLLEWDLKREAPAAKLVLDTSATGRDAVIITISRHNFPEDPDLTLDNAQLLLPISTSIESRIMMESDEYTTWRTATRAAFTHYLNLGYRAVSYLPETALGKEIGAYLLERAER